MRKVAWTTCLGGGEKKYNLAKEGSETRAEEDERGKKEGRKLLNLFIGDRAVERERKREFSFSSPLIARWDLPLFSGPLRENPGTDRRKKKEKKKSGIRSLLLFLSFPPPFPLSILFCFSGDMCIDVLPSFPILGDGTGAEGRRRRRRRKKTWLVVALSLPPFSQSFHFSVSGAAPPLLLRLLLATTPGTSIPSLLRRRPLTCT